MDIDKYLKVISPAAGLRRLNLESGRKIEQALEIAAAWKPPRELQKALPLPAVVKSAGPARIDVLRLCAYHGRPASAAYILHHDGSYLFSGQIRIDETVRRTQYAHQETVILDSRWVKEETCGWCSVTGKIFYCLKCGPICAGKSTGLYVRCYCGIEGMAVPQHFQHVGLVPRVL